MNDTDAGLPRVTVVVPVWNGEHTISDCVSALLGQDYPSSHLDIIVVDNNSTDRTKQIVSRHPVLLLDETELQTSYAARNRGAACAQGEIVAFTDADCIADPAWIRRLVEPFDDRSVGAVGGRIASYHPSSLVERYVAMQDPFRNYHRYENRFLPLLNGGNVAYRLDLFKALQGFDATLYTIADIDLSWRLQIETPARVVHRPDAVVYHRHRTTLRGLFYQQRRHGFGQILLTALYGSYDDYPYPAKEQFRILLRQMRALLSYLRSIPYRFVLSKLRPVSDIFVAHPFIAMVAELGAIWGRLSGMASTRLLTADVAERVWPDPLRR